jgi:hypothetical protein
MKSLLVIALCWLASVNAEADTLRKFDEYADLPFSEEKARLDNFGIQLQQVPDGVGWYVIFAGKVSCAGEARFRAVRAKNYLVKNYGIRSERIIWVDEGYREDLLVELWITPKWIGKLNPSNYSTYTKGSVVVRNCKSNYRKRRRPMKLKAAPNNSFNRSGISLSFIENLDDIRRYFPPG